MSSASPFREFESRALPGRGVQRLETLLVGSARRAGFWSAVVIPFVLLGLVASGAAVERAPLTAALAVANALALRLGHDHKRA